MANSSGRSKPKPANGNSASSGTSQMVAIQRTQSYSGPFPPPGLLETCERHHPGSTRIFVEQYEKQSDHRMAIERKVVDANVRNERWGLTVASILAVLVWPGIAAYMISLGYVGASLGVLAAEFGALVAMFLNRARKQRRDTQRKADVETPTIRESTER